MMRVTDMCESISTGSLQIFTLDRGGVMYWATTHKDGTMSLEQRYTKRNGTSGSRMVFAPALRAEAAAAISTKGTEP